MNMFDDEDELPETLTSFQKWCELITLKPTPRELMYMEDAFEAGWKAACDNKDK